MNQRRTLRRLTAALPAILFLIVSSYAHAQDGSQQPLIVRIRAGSSIVGLAQDYGLSVLDGITDRGVFEVCVLDQSALQETEIFLSFDSRVRYCEPEAGVTSPLVQATPFHIAFDISADAAAFLAQIAYDLIDLGSLGAPKPGCGIRDQNSVTVAVLDTGVNINHPALAGRLMDGYNAVVPGTDPLDLPDGQNNLVVGHGTMTTGLIARTAPDSLIMPIRVMNGDGIGTIMHVIKGVHYAVHHGAGVINMSFETAVNSIALADALDEADDAGVILVASAGNDSTNVPRYPAAYSTVVGAASVDDGDTLSSFSNYGVNATVVAPGSAVRSTYWDGTYATWSGTSFSAPFVSAEAAEIEALHPRWTAKHVVHRMIRTANNLDALNPGFAGQLGAGIIDVQAALATEDQ